MLYLSSPAIGIRFLRRFWPLLILVLALGACRDRTPVMTTRFNAFGTQVDLSLVGISQERARQAAALIEQDFGYLERDWHPWSPGPMGRVNQLIRSGESFVAPPSIMPLVRLGKRFEAQSDGLFNPAIGHLMELWGFHRDQLLSHQPPTTEEITRLVASSPSMSQVDIGGLELRGHNPALRLDFSAIAKACAIDLSIDHLLDTGVKNALLQAGGALRAIGDRSGQPWRIPIRRASGSGVLAILPIRRNESVVTTADYERNFIFEGALYHATLDPRTGWPASGTRAVTVVHTDTATAAAAATALFVAGPGEWPGVAEKMGVRYVLLLDTRGRVHMNPAMARRIELVDSDEVITLSEPLNGVATLAGPES